LWFFPRSSPGLLKSLVCYIYFMVLSTAFQLSFSIFLVLFYTCFFSKYL
jgi:hypothetical protein